MKPKKFDNSLLGIKIGNKSILDIQNGIEKFFLSQYNIFHIANLNPEIFALAYKDNDYRKIINHADAILIDGIGLQIAAKLLGVRVGERCTGTDFMARLIKNAAHNHQKVFFLGGNMHTARLTQIHFQTKYPELICFSDAGARNIKNETDEEKNRVFNIIKIFRPDFLFVAYGSPAQEKWIYGNKENLKGIVCMGVGGAFKQISGQVKRAPKLLSRLGLEWFWRFLAEPERLITKTPSYIFFSYLIIIAALKKLWRKSLPLSF